MGVNEGVPDGDAAPAPADAVVERLGDGLGVRDGDADWVLVFDWLAPADFVAEKDTVGVPEFVGDKDRALGVDDRVI